MSILVDTIFTSLIASLYNYIIYRYMTSTVIFDILYITIIIVICIYSLKFLAFISIKNCESLEYEILFIHNLYNN